MNSEIKIIHTPTEQEPYIIINKPAGLPSAPINELDTNNAFSMCAKIFPDVLKVHGRKEIEHGLVHRLDTVTEGVLLIASNQDFYDFIIEQQEKGLFTKTYVARCLVNSENARELGGFPVPPEIKIQENKEFLIQSMFRPYGKGNKEVRPVTEKSNEAALKKVGKKIIYSTNVKILKITQNVVDVECKLTSGFRHQIRNHLAWIGLPIINDYLYNVESLNTSEKILFKATELNFPIYLTNKQ